MSFLTPLWRATATLSLSDDRRGRPIYAADLREIIKKLDSAKQQEDRPKAACSCCQEARYQTQRISALGDRR
jgi:hypothetical protein